MNDQKHTQQFSPNTESTNTPNPLHQLRKADSVLSIVQADIPQPCIIVPSILTARGYAACCRSWLWKNLYISVYRR